MTILATVENDIIKLPLGVHLQDGLQVRIETLLSDPDNAVSSRWSDDYFAKTAGAMVHEQFERPRQDPLETREVW
jgi:hypothetical protein